MEKALLYLISYLSIPLIEVCFPFPTATPGHCAGRKAILGSHVIQLTMYYRCADAGTGTGETASK